MANLNFTETTLKHFERGPITRTEYSNGAVFLHHRTPKMKGVLIGVWFLAGSRDEIQRKEEGLCHLLEHMMFKGGSAIKGSKLLSLLESLGAEINAYTTKEYVCFDLSCLVDNLPKILPLFLDLIFSPSFLHHEFVKEKKVVLQEIREDRDDHELEAEERLIEKSFDYPLGHLITGSIKSVEGFTIRDLNQFYHEHFVPRKMVISMVGDNSKNKYQDMLAELFSKYHLTKKNKPYRRKMEKGFGEISTFKEKMKRGTENPYLFLTTRSAPIDSEYRADFMLLNHYLAEGMSSRFFKALRDEEGLLYGISSYVNNFSDNGSLVISLTAQQKNLKKIEQKITDIFADVAINGIGEERLVSCKKQILSSWQMAFDDMGERNEHFAKGEIYRKHVLSYKEIKKMMGDVSDTRIKHITQTVLEGGISSLVVQ